MNAMHTLTHTHFAISSMRLQIFIVPEDEGSLKVSNDVGSVSYHGRNGGMMGATLEELATMLVS